MRRATENTGGGEWKEMPEGLFRWVIGTPTVKFLANNPKPAITFPLTLTEPEKERLKAEYGEPDEGVLQSWRPAFGGYTVGPSLGWIDRTGKYNTTKLVDFLVAAVGAKNQSQLRKYFEQGGGPALTDDAPVEEQMAELQSWLTWWENLEILGSIKHETGQRGLLARFGGPMAVGTPGTLWGADPDYQTHGKGKLRMILLQGGVTDDDEPKYTAKGEPVRPGETMSDLAVDQMNNDPPSDDDDEETKALKALQAARAKKAASTGKAPERTYDEVFSQVPA